MALSLSAALRRRLPSSSFIGAAVVQGTVDVASAVGSGASAVSAVVGDVLKIVDPFTGQQAATLAAATEDVVDAAAAAAAAAAPRWASADAAHRARALRAIGAAVQRRKEEFTEIEAWNTGRSVYEVASDIDAVVSCFQFCADMASLHVPRMHGATVTAPAAMPHIHHIQHQPVGPVAAIVPWNYPLLMASWKVAPALAAGCPVVLKPSELTPFTALLLAELATQEAQLPPGVFSVVVGDGRVGADLASHPLIAHVTVTGSVATGKSVAAAAGANLKRCSLELGGKNSAIIWPDCHLPSTVEWVMAGAFGANGQICSATSRVLVHADIAQAFHTALAAKTNSIVIGNPLDPATRLGPLISAHHRDKVLKYIKEAEANPDMSLVCGGSQPVAEFPDGNFVRPTVFTNVPIAAPLWRDEVFGPVLACRTFTSDEDAVGLANDTEFGLAAALFSNDQARMDAVIPRLSVGTVWCNASQVTVNEMPWGGMKASGIGRDMGPNALLKYMEPRAVYQVAPGLKAGLF